MIKKLHEEWEKLSQEARQMEADPRRQAEMVTRLDAMARALQKMSHASVTRVSLAQAVRDALLDVLKSERESLFPELPRMAAELGELKVALQRETAARVVSPPPPAPAIEGLARRLDALESRMAQEPKAASQKNGEALQSRLGVLEEGLESLRSALRGAALREEAGRTAAADAGEILKALQARVARGAETLESFGERLQEHRGDLQSRLSSALSSAGVSELRLSERLDLLEAELSRREEESLLRAESLGARSLDAASRSGTEAQRISTEAQRIGTEAQRVGAEAREAASQIAAGLASLESQTSARLQDLEARLGEAAAQNVRQQEESARKLEGLAELAKVAASEAARRGEELDGRLRQESERLGTLAQDLGSADDHLAEGVKEMDGRLGSRIGALEASAASSLEALEARLRQSLAAAETRLVEAHGKFEADLTRVEDEASRAGRGVDERVARIEAVLPELTALAERLQKQIGITMEHLEDRVNVLVEVINQMQAEQPPRKLFEGLDERMLRIETRLRTVSDRLDTFEVSLPGVAGLSEQISGIRGEVSDLAGEINSSTREQRDVWEVFQRRVQDLQESLRAGLERWDADRTSLRQRLSDLRDTLRDQLRSLSERAGSGSGTFWNKLLARPESGPRIENEEWERLRSRLETIVQGLEALLVEGK